MPQKAGIRAFIQGLPVKFALVDERKSVTFRGNWLWVGVQFCKAVELSLYESQLSEFSDEMQALLKETIKPIGGAWMHPDHGVALSQFRETICASSRNYPDHTTVTDD